MVIVQDAYCRGRSPCLPGCTTPALVVREPGRHGDPMLSHKDKEVGFLVNLGLVATIPSTTKGAQTNDTTTPTIKSLPA